MEFLNGNNHISDKVMDMHCHILPELDDGSITMEETIAALKKAKGRSIAPIAVQK